MYFLNPARAARYAHTYTMIDETYAFMSLPSDNFRVDFDFPHSAELATKFKWQLGLSLLQWLVNRVWLWQRPQFAVLLFTWP